MRSKSPSDMHLSPDSGWWLHVAAWIAERVPPRSRTGLPASGDQADPLPEDHYCGNIRWGNGRASDRDTSRNHEHCEARPSDATDARDDHDGHRAIRGNNPLDNNVDIVHNVISYASGDGYLFVAGVSSTWRRAWPKDLPKETDIAVAVQSSRLLAWARVANCPWNEVTCSLAAAGGYLDTIKYARTGVIQKRRRPDPAWITGEVREWLEHRGFLAPPEEFREPDVELAFTPCLWDDETCANAAQGGHLRLLQWCRANGCPWDECTCACAAEGGFLRILKWCRANGCPWDEWTSTFAAQKGHADVLMWSTLNDCPRNAEVCAAVARRGRLRLLRWCRAHGCPWDAWTCARAARGGHLRLLKWCRANGCPWDYRTLREAARRGPDDRILQWCRANGCPEAT